MKLHPRVTRAGVELVKRFEGYRRHAAKLSDGGFVLGYGHTLTAREGAEVSQADAEALLWFDLSHVAETVEGVVMAPTSAPQFEALTSFAFNIGLENFSGSTVVRRLNEGAYLQAAAAIELWRRAEFDGDARVVDALVRRRAAEKAHFLTPPEGFAPAPTGVIRPTFDYSVLAAALAWGERGEATVVNAPALDGETATPTLADPPGREHGDGAPSAAIAAMDALSARLGAILPDAPAAEPQPLVLTPDEGAPTPHVVDASPADSGLDLPPPPVAMIAALEAAPVVTDEAPSAPPPVRAFAFEPLSPAPAASAPTVSASVFQPLAPPAVIDASAFKAPAAAASPMFEPLSVAAARPSLFQSEPVANDAEPPPPVERRNPARPLPKAEAVLENPLVFLVLGLVGVALFAGAVVCMFKHPSLLCLLCGLAGVLAIAPAAAFFLFRLIGSPVEAPVLSTPEAREPFVETLAAEPVALAVEPEAVDEAVEMQAPFKAG